MSNLKVFNTAALKRHWPLIRILEVAAFLVIIGLLALFVFSKKKETTLSVKVEGLTISLIEKAPFHKFIPITGTVLPLNTFYLVAVEGGIVEEVYLEAGSKVRAGDPILKLGNTNLLLDIMRREAELFQQSNSLRNTRLAMEQYQLQLSQQLAEIENQLQQQKRVFERYEELARDSLISRHEYELVKDQYEYLLKRKQMTVESQKSELNLRRTQVADLEDSLQRMQANLDVVKQKQENLTVKAPVSGQVTSLNAVAGQSKSPGERLGQIDQLDGFMVRSAVEEKYIALVDADTRGEAEINGNTYGLKVHKISPEVVDGKFEVEFYFRGDRPRGMKRGQSLQVRLELGETSEATLLPLGNFLAETGGKWVYVLDRSEKFALKRKVRLGQQNNQTIEVLDGLKPGDRVITSSYESFNGVEKLLLKSSSKPSAL